MSSKENDTCESDFLTKWRCESNRFIQLDSINKAAFRRIEIVLAGLNCLTREEIPSDLVELGLRSFGQAILKFPEFGQWFPGCDSIDICIPSRGVEVIVTSELHDANTKHVAVNFEDYLIKAQKEALSAGCPFKNYWGR